MENERNFSCSSATGEEDWGSAGNQFLMGHVYGIRQASRILPRKWMERLSVPRYSEPMVEQLGFGKDSGSQGDDGPIPPTSDP